MLLQVCTDQLTKGHIVIDKSAVREPPNQVDVLKTND